MRRVLLQSALALTSMCALGGGARAASVVGHSYQVRIETSYGQVRYDCFTFDSTGHTGGNFLGTLDYFVNFAAPSLFTVLKPLSQADMTGLLFFSGKVTNRAITMIGSDDSGNSYYITGLTATCNAARSNSAQGMNR